MVPRESLLGEPMRALGRDTFGESYLGMPNLPTVNILNLVCLQCFDAVGWAAGRASGL